MTTTPDDRAPIDPSAAPRAATSTELSIDPRLAEGDCTVPLSADVDPSAWPEPVQALAHTPGSGARPTSLAELTTLRVGGPVGSYVEATTQSELTEAIREADAAGAREMPPRYRTLARRWELLGYPAFCATVVIYFLMVFKPM